MTTTTTTARRDLTPQLAELLTCASWRLRRASRQRARAAGAHLRPGARPALLARAGDPCASARWPPASRSCPARPPRWSTDSRRPASWRAGRPRRPPLGAGLPHRRRRRAPRAAQRARRASAEALFARLTPAQQEGLLELLAVLNRARRRRRDAGESARMMGPGGFTALRSLRRDQSVKDAKIAKGTTRRILTFVAPYRKRLLALFLVLVVHRRDGERRQPADLPRDHRQRHPRATTPALIVWLACSSPSWRSPTRRSRWSSATSARASARGSIYDMRTQVFDHVQRMPHRLLHPHADRRPGQPPQQRRHGRAGGLHRHPLERHRQPHQRGIVLVDHVPAVVAAHARRARAAAGLPAAGALAGPPAAGDHARALRAQRRDEQRHGRALQRRRSAAREALRPPRGRERAFKSKAARVRDIDVVQAIYGRFFFIALLLTAALATALVYGWGGVLAVTARSTSARSSPSPPT